MVRGGNKDDTIFGKDPLPGLGLFVDLHGGVLLMELEETSMPLLLQTFVHLLYLAVWVTQLGFT